jgi:metal-sulfur cluster biosynthetic enzyme
MDTLNPNPVVYEVDNSRAKKRRRAAEDEDDNRREPVDAEEVFELVRHIIDPEHPVTLEQLKVLNEDHILVDDAGNHVLVQFTPTIPHCSMATLIGLCVRVKLQRSLPRRFKVTVKFFFFFLRLRTRFRGVDECGCTNACFGYYSLTDNSNSD